ncbi:PAS domain-containing sensor histidine kinase [Bacteroidota bacterium]
MILKSLYINLIIRVIVMGLTCLALGFCFYMTDLFFANINLLLFIVLQIALLIRYLNKINRDLKKFFISVRNEDSSLVFFPEDSNKPKDEFQNCLDEMNSVIRKIRIENEKQNQYFKNVVEHVGIGLLSYNESGKIELYNNAVLSLFQISSIKYISELDNFHENFSQILTDIKPGETQLVEIKSLYNSDQDQYDILNLSIKASEFILMKKRLKLLSFQNIKRELEGKELESWQKLTRVLAHEIMNSVSPLTSLAKTILKYFKKDEKPKNPDEINTEIIDKTIDGLNIIEERGEGLLTFIGDYRSYASLPKPVIEQLTIVEIFQNIHKLLSEKIEAENILIVKDVFPDELKLVADKKFLEQMLINLINNSISVLKKKSEDKIIKLRASKGHENSVIIQVTDNGEGIAEELLDKIFIPFFTTKDKGSGIGLSLCRQIMHLHGGSISVVSDPGVETTFTLKF